MKKPDWKLPAVFLLSAAVIAYELVVMRSFSVGSWSNFGSMVISIALLGFGLTGTFLTFIQDKVKKNPDIWLAGSAFLLLPSMALAHILAQQVPFNPVLISSDPVQLWWIAAYYLIYAVPFICGALFIGVAFISWDQKIHELYFWNMAGSGAGGFLILGCMYLFPPDTLQIPVLLVTFLACLFCYLSWQQGKEKTLIKTWYLPAGIISLAGCILLILFFGKIQVSDYKSVSYTRNLPEYHLDYYSYSPLGEMHLYSSSYFHSAPGLSDNAGTELTELPMNAFKRLYIDGAGPISVMKKVNPREEEYINFLPMAAPYKLLDKPSVLIINPGGGMGIFTALHFASPDVVAVESNPDIIHLLKDVPLVKAFNDGLLENPLVNVVQAEPRAYVTSTKKRFNLIEISLIDSVGLSDIGGYPVVENFVYTKEAVRDYMHALNRNGILSLTVWNKLSPPRNVMRLLTTVIDSMRMQGVQNPENRIFCFQLLLQTATILIKNSGFTSTEIDALKAFCTRMSFETCYYPGMPERELDFNQLLNEYEKLFKPEIGSSGVAAEDDSFQPEEEESGSLLTLLEESKEETDTVVLNPGDLYHFTIKWMLSGKREELFRRYIFDIRPATDNRPYYTAYLKPAEIGTFLPQLKNVSEEWGYIMLLGTFLQSILFGLLIIFIPMFGKWKELFKKRKGTLRVILYYACLGLGYMLVEIYLIQRFVFFLGDPIISLSLVITSMLVISGVGSLFGHKLAAKRSSVVRIAVAGICLSLLFYIFGINPVLNGMLGLPLILKAVIAILLISPAAFFLGIPFPNGMSALTTSRKGLLPWAWGMNGALSVTGSVLARLVSVSYGFAAILGGAILLYILAGLVYKANELS